MKKTIIYIIVLLVILIGAWQIFGGDGASTEPSTEGELGPVTQTKAEGIVTGIDLEQAMVDGPYVVTLRESNGSEAIVAIPSMGILLCAARDNILDVSTLSEGDAVEVNGTLTSEGSIVPCESAEHYFRLAESK